MTKPAVPNNPGNRLRRGEYDINDQSGPGNAEGLCPLDLFLLGQLFRRSEKVDVVVGVVVVSVAVTSVVSHRHRRLTKLAAGNTAWRLPRSTCT